LAPATNPLAALRDDGLPSHACHLPLGLPSRTRNRARGNKPGRSVASAFRRDRIPALADPHRAALHVRPSIALQTERQDRPSARMARKSCRQDYSREGDRFLFTAWLNREKIPC
jgi:hypothetical protein